MSGEVFKQERPPWCPHVDCVFKRRAMHALCSGRLPVPVDHDGDLNTHRVCINTTQEAKPSTLDVVDLQVNTTDVDWFRWILDSVDGKKTSWLSKREGQGDV